MVCSGTGAGGRSLLGEVTQEQELCRAPSASTGGLKDVSTLMQLLLHRPLVGRCPEMCSGWLTHCTLFMDRRKAKLKGSQALDRCAAAFVVLVVFNA